MVLGIVFFTFAGLIRYAYVLHDSVTGSMILTEVLDEARYCHDETVSMEVFEQRGRSLGNPRLWLGEYRISMNEKASGLSGTAEAGDWGLQIDMKKSHAPAVLRGAAAVEEMERYIDDGSGVQTGDEPELHGSLSKDSAK